MTPRVSIVIPTHNRRAVLERCLASLVLQSYPLSLIEVIVVADGCTDGTEHLAMPPGLAGRVITQPSRGAAAARNTGAASATGHLLVFLDDDVDASPDLVAAHVHAQTGRPGPTVVVGCLTPQPQQGDALFRATLRGWWNTMFERMRQPGHRFTYADVLTGNCSIPRWFFESVHGFEEQLRCHEDYEFGFRVLAAGGAIAFEPAAGGSHVEITDLPRSLRRKFDEGIADTWIARAHPGIWPALPLARPRTSRRAHVIRRLALTRPIVGWLFDTSARATLRVLARARLRDRWRVRRDELLLYWYWRGVATALSGISFETFASEITARLPPPEDLPVLDLRPGLAAAMRALDDLDAPGVVLTYGGVHVGTIAAQPWAEPLRGRHLRHVLSTKWPAGLGKAIWTAHALGGAITDGPETARLLVSMSLAGQDGDGRL